MDLVLNKHQPLELEKQYRIWYSGT